MRQNLVAYYSKTDSTRRIAEAISDQIGVAALPLNSAQTGRRSKEDREREVRLVSTAVERANQAELVVLGTPTEFRRPHPKVMEVIGRRKTNRAEG